MFILFALFCVVLNQPSNWHPLYYYDMAEIKYFVYDTNDATCTGNVQKFGILFGNKCGANFTAQPLWKDYIKIDCTSDNQDVMYVNCYWSEFDDQADPCVNVASCETANGHWGNVCYPDYVMGSVNPTYPTAGECFKYVTDGMGEPGPNQQWCDWNIFAGEYGPPTHSGSIDNYVVIKCSKYISCDPECDNGFCTDKGECQDCIEADTYGPDCLMNENEYCEYKCNNGTCINGVCTCDVGYSGEWCDQHNFYFFDFSLCPIAALFGGSEKTIPKNAMNMMVRMREIRDGKLMVSPFGRWMVNAYYELSKSPLFIGMFKVVFYVPLKVISWFF